VTSPTNFLHSLVAELSISTPVSSIILQSLHHLLVSYPELTRELNGSEFSKLISPLGDSTVHEQAEVLKHTIDILQLLAKGNPSSFVGLPILDHICLISRLPHMDPYLPEIVELIDTLASSTSYSSSITKKDEGILARIQELESQASAESQKVKLANLLHKLSSIASFSDQNRQHGQNGKAHEINSINETAEHKALTLPIDEGKNTDEDIHNIDRKQEDGEEREMKLVIDNIAQREIVEEQNGEAKEKNGEEKEQNGEKEKGRNGKEEKEQNGEGEKEQNGGEKEQNGEKEKGRNGEEKEQNGKEERERDEKQIKEQKEIKKAKEEREKIEKEAQSELYVA